MGGISSQSPAVLKKTTGAANVGTSGGDTVEEFLGALSLSLSGVIDDLSTMMPKAGGSFTGWVGFQDDVVISNNYSLRFYDTFGIPYSVIILTPGNSFVFNASNIAGNVVYNVKSGHRASFQLDNTIEAFNYTIDGVQIGTGQRITGVVADGTLSANADYYLPSQKAVKTYVDNSVSAIPSGYASMITSADISSAVSAIDILLTGAYDEYIIELINVIPSSDNTGTFLRLLTSSDGGTSFDTGASDYAFYVSDIASSGGSDASAAVSLMYEGTVDRGIGAAANERGYSGTIKIFAPGEAEYTHLKFESCHKSAEANSHLRDTFGSAVRLSAGVVDAVRLVLSQYDFASGKVAVYGVNR